MTRTERETLLLIEGYIDQHGYAPTIRELTSLRGITSTSSIKRYLDRLEEGGYIRRTGGWRGIILTKQEKSAALAFKACRMLVLAYANGKERGDHVDWSEVDAAYAVALDAIEYRETGQ